MRVTSRIGSGPVRAASRNSLAGRCEGRSRYRESDLHRRRTWTRSRGPVNDYDTLDRIKKVSYTSGDSTSYVYDANGNLTSVTDKRGTGAAVTTTYTIDNLNRLVSETRAGATVQSYGYDLNDNLET